MNKEMATPTVQLENNHLRVTEWRFAPGAATGWHRLGQHSHGSSEKIRGHRAPCSTTPHARPRGVW
jgi:hypothetical protein